MDQQKIDRLFREKLDNFEVMPSPEAWGKVERKIGAKRSSTKFYWIAAAVTLLIISWVVRPQNSVQDMTPIASDVSYPPYVKGPEWSLPTVAEKPKEEKEAVTQKPVKQQPDVQLIAQAEKEDIDRKLQEEAPQAISETETTVALEENAASETETMPEEVKLEEMTTEDVKTEETETNAPLKVDLSKVKITYIASAEQKKQEADSLKGIKKLFAFAGKLSPGEVLADIKTAKDDLINGGLKSKSKDRTSL